MKTICRYPLTAFIGSALALAGLLAFPGGATAAANDTPQRRTCASYPALGLPETPRATDVKPTYPLEMFEASLAEIPRYQPGPPVEGKITIWGSDYIGSHLAGYWQKGFGRHHPKLDVEYKLVNALTAIPSVALGIGDLAPSRAVSWAELFLFERVNNYSPLEVAMATGAWSSSFSIFVHKENPLAHLTMEQLDGIFGAARSGGYVGTQWHPENGRGPEKNIRTWGQLGLTGEWADKPINVYGSILNGFLNRHFERLVFKGGVKWNEAYREYETCIATDGEKLYRQDQFSADMTQDRYGIAFGYQAFGRKPLLKVLPIGRTDAGPFVELTVRNLHNHSYPMAQNYYVYINRKPGTALPPGVKEYMKYILSREGQTAIARHGKYIPLTAEAVRRELLKLD